MRKLLLAALLLFSSLGLHAQTVPVTGNLKTVLGENLGTNTFIRFRLRNYKPNRPLVSGVGIIGQTTKDVAPDSNGLISTTVFDNDLITPSGTFYTLEFYLQSRFVFAASYEITGAAFDFNTATPLSSVPMAAVPVAESRVFTHIQATPATTWVIIHNFAVREVTLDFYDASFNRIFPDLVTLTDINTVTALFVVAQTGRVVVMRAENVNLTSSISDPVLKVPTTSQSISGGFDLTLDGNFLLATTGQNIGSPTVRPDGFFDVSQLGVLNAVRWVDGNKFTTCQVAVDDLGANRGLVIIRSTYTGAECTTSPETVIVLDLRNQYRFSKGTSGTPIIGATAANAPVYIRNFDDSADDSGVDSELIGNGNAHPNFRIQVDSNAGTGHVWGIHTQLNLNKPTGSSNVAIFGGVQQLSGNVAAAWGMNSQINRLVGAATTENGTSIEISLENNVTPVGPHTSGRMIGAFASSFGTNEGDAAFFTNSANSASRWNEGLHIEDVSTIGIHLGSPITSSSALPLPVLGMQFDPRDVATSGGSFNSPRIRLNISAWNGSSADTRNAEIEAIALTGPTRAALRWLLDATEVIRADDTEFVVNDGGLSTVDFRVESDNQTNMLFVDASADTLLVSGASTFSAGVVLSGGVLEYNDAPTLAASTTPSVTGGNVFLTNSTASITDFTGEQNGQVITLLCEADTTTSLVDSTPLFLAGAFTCTADDTISLISNGTVWYETSRSVN